MARPCASAEAVNQWLLGEARQHATVAAFQDALAHQLRAHAPVQRLWIGTKVIHPQAAAYVWVHEDAGPTVSHELSYDRFARLESVDSPARRLRDGAPFVRFRCDQPAADAPADVLGLGERGYTELYGLSMEFRGEWVGGTTWATRAPGGFQPEHIALFDQVMPTLSAVIEPLARDMVLATLLRTYLGADAGQRVFAGQVRRGDQQTLRSAVWFSDIRGFTRLSAELSRTELLDLINEIFEAQVEELAAHGGQVLKFLGDGLLAVFPAASSTASERDACARAAAAGTAVQDRLAAQRARRRDAGQPAAEVGIGLHFGEVTYGNIGAPGRLDFTVIGPAVNLAARVEGLCSTTRSAVLATGAFAHRTEGWTLAGTWPVKGVVDPIEVYAPPAVH